MNNFKLIYRILKILENALDHEEFDPTLLNAEDLGVSSAKLSNILKMLVDEAYIVGVIYKTGLIGVKITKNTRITLKGLEYLEENSLMKKASKLAKGIIDICT